MFVIQSTGGDGDCYLVEGTKSRGSAAGVGRVWSGEIGNALRFETREEADATVQREWAYPDERKFFHVRVVEV